MTLHWALALKSFDDEAPKTILAQHDLLQLLVDAADPTLSLTVRVAASIERGQVNAGCYMLCEGSHRAKATAATLLDVASVGLLPGYSISNVRAPRVHHEGGFAEVAPILRPGSGLPIKPDWAQIIDLLRRRGRPIVIDLRCAVTTPGTHIDVSEPTVLGTDPGTGVLQALSVSGPTDRTLNLSVVVSEPRRVDRIFAGAMGRKLFGTTCDVVEIQDESAAEGGQFAPHEALRVWHWPYGDIQGRGLGRSTVNLPLISAAIPKNGMSLGHARQEGPKFDQWTDVYMSPSDRMKHIYVVGKTGSGKTNLMKRIARQDIAQGKGCVVISPHADLINFLVDSAGDRADDIILLDFGDKNYVPQMNPLAVDVSSDAEYARAAEQLTDLVSGLSYHEFTGPVFHDAVRTALQTAALPEIRGDRDPNIAVAVEIVRDSALRGWAAKIARNSRRDLELDLSRVADLRASERSEYERWVTAKFDSFAVNGPLRSVTSTAGGCPLSFKEIYRNQKVLLVHLPDTYLGGNSAELIGRFIFERLYQEARQTQATSRKDFYIHVDEFQRFVNRDLEILVTEARKFKMGLTFAHQNLRQLHAFSRFEGTASPRLAEAIFSNVGTLIAMRTSGSDVGTIAAELEVREQHVRRIGQYEALARPSLAGAEQRTCTLRVPLESVPANRKVRAELRKRMIREGYWASRTTVERGLESHFAALRESVDGSPQRRKLPASSSKSGNQKSFLDEWLEKRKSKSAGSGDQTTDDSKGISA